MKHLPPTLREDQRYLKLKINSDEGKGFSQAVELINSAVKDFAGEKGLAEISPWLIKRKFGFEEQIVLVRINRDFEDMFRASIVLADSQVVTLKASGSLKSL